MTNRSTGAFPETRYYISHSGITGTIPADGRVALREIAQDLQELLRPEADRRVAGRNQGSQLSPHVRRRNPLLVHRRRSGNTPLMQPKTTEKAKEYGRGNRVRKQVNYCDDANDANDDQMLNSVDDEEQQEEESSLIDVPKRRRRGRNLLKEIEKSRSIDPA